MNIRYHHLMCIPRFKGKGYNEKFCVNMKKVQDYINGGGKFNFIEHCDDICAHCPNMAGEICKDEEQVKRYDALVKSAVENGETPLPENICKDCQWYSICKDINI